MTVNLVISEFTHEFQTILVPAAVGLNAHTKTDWRLAIAPRRDGREIYFYAQRDQEARHLISGILDEDNHSWSTVIHR